MKTKLNLIRLALLGAMLLSALPSRAATTVTKIAAGYEHSLFIKSDGSLWVMGYDGDGELGVCLFIDYFIPFRIVAGAVVPVITGINLSGTNLVINGSNGVSGGTYFTRMNTNLANPLSQWPPIATNVLGANGNFTITVTNTVNKNMPQRFYLLQLQ
jgi:hypothetical protein